MTPEVREQLKQSSQAFKDVIWPIIGSRIGGGELIRVETVTASGFANSLDTLAGIDAWQVIGKYGIRGIASRVQPTGLGRNGKTWETFTIRLAVASGVETEYAKRLRAIENPGRGWLYPHLTIHSYVTGDWKQALSIATIRTRDLIIFARDNPGMVDIKPVEGGNTMMVISWHHLHRANIELVIWPEGLFSENGK